MQIMSFFSGNIFYAGNTFMQAYNFLSSSRNNQLQYVLNDAAHKLVVFITGFRDIYPITGRGIALVTCAKTH